MNAIPARSPAWANSSWWCPPGRRTKSIGAGRSGDRGVDRVFTIGGAQAVAALAYGTATVPQVDKIVGPATPTSRRPSVACSAPSAST